MAATEHVVKITADTAEFEAKIKRLRREVRSIGLAANVALIGAMLIGIAAGMILGLVIA